MTRRKEIVKAAHQNYPYEGGTLGMICERSIPIFIQGAEWADKTMIDKFLYWLTTKSPFIDNKDMDKAIVELRKYLEE